LPAFPLLKRELLRNFLSRFSKEEGTLVFFLPMRKIKNFIEVAKEVFGPREVVLARELTKIHEEFIRGNLENLLNQLTEEKIRGEATILIKGK
jgi:Predicted methyltransferases